VRTTDGAGVAQSNMLAVVQYQRASGVTKGWAEGLLPHGADGEVAQNSLTTNIV